MNQEQKQAKILPICPDDPTPFDIHINTHIQNLFATYGEDFVRASLKDLFGMESPSTEIQKAG